MAEPNNNSNENLDLKTALNLWMIGVEKKLASLEQKIDELTKA